MSSRNRKYDSGAEKRRKKQRLEAAAQYQKGALDRFVPREAPGANVDDNNGDDAVQVEAPTQEIEVEAPARDANVYDTHDSPRDGVEDVETPDINK